MNDFKFAFRQLLKNPGFTAVAVLTLALGIGANTAIFSLVDAVLLKRLPVKNPGQLVLLRHADSRATITQFPYDTYKQFRDQNQVFSSVLAYYPLRLTVSVGDQPEPAVAGQLVSGNYYSVLGVNAAVGRTIVPDDDRAPGESPVCVISYNYWQRRFAGDPAIVGKTVQLGGASFTIVGVTPPEFFGLEVGSSMDISIPLMMHSQATPGVESVANSGRYVLTLMGRLRRGETMQQAHAGLGALYRQMVAEYASQPGKRSRESWLEERLVFESGGQGLSELRRQFSRPLLVLMIVVVLVLLVACANVAGLLLARAVTRRKEIAIRLALGGGRLRLGRQLLTESILLGALGGLFGLLFAHWGSRLLLPLLSQGEIPAQLNLHPDARVLGFAIVVSVLTGMVFGLAPAFWATRVDLNSAIKNDASDLASGSSSRAGHLTFGKLFVVSQVALSLLLLIGAGLFMRSLQKLQRVDGGFARENVLVMKLEPVGSERKSPRLAARYDELLRQVRTIPAVQSASLVGYSPMSRREWLVMGDNPESSNPISIPGHTPASGEELRIPYMQVYANSFATLGIPLLAGRDFAPEDDRVFMPGIAYPKQEVTQVAVINQSMARRFYGSTSPIGQRFIFFYPYGTAGDGSRNGGPQEIEIIGVVKDVKYASLRNEGRAMFYLPFHQSVNTRGQMTLVVRMAGEVTPVAAAVRRAARTMDPRMPLFEVETLATQVAASLREERLLATLSSGFGLLALLLSCLGLYGILSYTVAQRTREIGIRMALGAARGDVLWLVMRDVLRLVLFGVALGIPAALAASRLLASQLFGISTADPVAIGLATLVLSVVAIVAGYLPSRRATLVNPMTALRNE